MKHRIVGDHHQLLAIEMNAGEELLIFEGNHIFSKGNIELRDAGQDFTGTGLTQPELIISLSGTGMAGIGPKGGGHLKRVEIGPPSGLVAAAESIFVLSRGVTASEYNPIPELAAAFENARLIELKGIGMAFLRTEENFIEFTLGADEELMASSEHIVAFSGGIKLKPAPAAAGACVVIFGGPGNLTLASK